MKAFRDKTYIIIKCPGCNDLHLLDKRWTFNEDFANPTFTPSLLITTGKYVTSNYKELIPEEDWEFWEESSIRCHSFITNGKIQFLSDCTHSLKDQTVDLLDIDDTQQRFISGYQQD